MSTWGDNYSPSIRIPQPTLFTRITSVPRDLLTAVDKSAYDSLDYLPFGEQIAGGSGTTHKFTGKERDAESGLDNFGARYDSSSMGRFMSPDWAAKPTTVPYAVFGDPQSLNLYAYVENAPVNRADADGHSDPPPMYNCAYSS